MGLRRCWVLGQLAGVTGMIVSLSAMAYGARTR